MPTVSEAAIARLPSAYRSAFGAASPGGIPAITKRPASKANRNAK